MCHVNVTFWKQIDYGICSKLQRFKGIGEEENVYRVTIIEKL